MYNNDFKPVVESYIGILFHTKCSYIYFICSSLAILWVESSAADPLHV